MGSARLATSAKALELDLIFNELYAGGKYDNNKASGAYEYSLGSWPGRLRHAAARSTNVYSYDGTHEHKISFRKGSRQASLPPQLKKRRHRHRHPLETRP